MVGLFIDKLDFRLQSVEDHSYSIYIGQGLLDNLMNWLNKHFPSGQVVVISDTIVFKLYVPQLLDILNKMGLQVLLLEINPGERSKTSKVKENLELKMLEHKITRHSLCIAFGGGVVGDLAGFIAATYMRGIRYIQVPTTLLSMVDSSIGGKTAINTKFSKNSIGAFYQPQAVFIDLNFLDTLPKKHIINGLVEATKIFLTSSNEYFVYLEANLDDILSLDKVKLKYIISKAISLKAGVVEADEKENNLRMILNFGHTIGHAIENVTGYRVLHGYAVALGIIVEAQVSLLLGKLSNDNFERIIKLLARLKISSKLLANIDIQEVALATIRDKKNINQDISCVLLKDIGSVALNEELVVSVVKYSTILEALKLVQNKIG